MFAFVLTKMPLSRSDTEMTYNPLIYYAMNNGIFVRSLGLLLYLLTYFVLKSWRVSVRM